MDAWQLLLDLLIVLAAALVAGVVFERLRQSAIVGYLLAGMALGPHAFNLVGNHEEVELLAELGVALLLFSIGLEFSWRRLLRMGRMAFGGGGAQVLATVIIASLLSMVGGYDWRTGIVFGAAFTLSSTAVVMRLLMQRAELDSLHGRNAVAILLFQDLAVVPLVVLVSLLGGEGGLGQAAFELVRTLGLGAALVAVFYIAFNYVAPRVLGSHLMSRNRDLPILLALVTALGSSWAAHQAHLSPALGAFVAGILLAESPFATQVRADVSSLRTLLVTLFFSSVGMLANPAWMVDHLGLLAAAVGLIVVGKTAITAGAVRVMGQTVSQAVATGVCLAQVGEFAFVLAAIGREDVLDADGFALLISAAILTMLIAPYQVSLAPAVGMRLARWWGKGKPMERPARSADEEDDVKQHIMIIGFGPAGQGAAAGLIQGESQVTVLDASKRGADAARQMGFVGLVGDGTSVDMLEHAGVSHADVVIVTLPDPGASRRVIANVRSLNRKTRIVVRARYHVYRWELMLAGADVVVDEEEQIGLRLAAEMRKQLRAKSPESGATDAADVLSD